MRTEDDLLCLHISPPVFWCHTSSVDRSCGADLHTLVQLYCYNPSSVSFNLCAGMYKNPQKSRRMCPLQPSPSPVFLRRLNQLWVKTWTLCSPTLSCQTLSKILMNTCRSELMFVFIKQCTGQEWEKMLSECLHINWTTKINDLSWLLDSFQHLYSRVRVSCSPVEAQQAQNESAASKLSNTTAEVVLSISSGVIRSQIITPVWYSVQHHDFECDIAFIQMFHKCIFFS